ncbi:hypothetical protein LINGRAHAP2_LOCUS28056 [Linum grandiflorum]
MAAQIHKLEVKVAMKSPEKLVSFFTNHILEIPKLAPAIVKTCEIIGGGTHMSPGSVFHVTLSIPGTTELITAKAKLEDVDEVGGKNFALRVIEGNVIQKYPSYISKAVIVNNAAGDGGGEVTWTIEYQKADSTTPPPLDYVPLYTLLTQVIDNFNY